MWLMLQIVAVAAAVEVVGGASTDGGKPPPGWVPAGKPLPDDPSLLCQPTVSEPNWPTFHLLGNASRAGGGGKVLLGKSGDANAIFRFRGLYHAMNQAAGANWAHAVSSDLVHWYHVKEALTNYASSPSWDRDQCDGTVSFPDLGVAPFNGSSPVIMYGPNCGEPVPKPPNGSGGLGTTDAPRVGTARAAAPVSPYLLDWVKPSPRQPVQFLGIPCSFPGRVWKSKVKNDTWNMLCAQAAPWPAGGTGKPDGAWMKYTSQSNDLLTWKLDPTPFSQTPDGKPSPVYPCSGPYFHKLPGTPATGSPTHLLQGGCDGDSFTLGKYDSETEVFTVVSSWEVDVADLGRWGQQLSYHWGAAGRDFPDTDPDTDAGRLFTFAWIASLSIGCEGCIPSMMSLVRELRYDAAVGVTAYPVEEYEAKLRNGTILNETHHPTSLANGARRTLPVPQGAGGALDILVSFDVNITAGASDFGVAVRASPRATAEAALIVTVQSISESDAAGRRNVTILFTPPSAGDAQRRTVSNETYHAVKTVPLLSGEKTLDIRVLVDRPVVEAFVQGGRTSYVSADTPFAVANSSAHVFNSGAQPVVVRSLEVYTMGCGWSPTLPKPRTTLKSDDGKGGPEITLGAIDWSAPPLKVASTASTVEVDVMPFLSRVQEGGPFDAYFTALSDLGAEFVRFSPWYGYPRVVVTELTPPDCNATKPQTNWNSTLFDAIMSDFMLAVCGPDAVSGKCKHSVAQQISTMPSWLYVGGINASDLPADPWQYHGMDTYDAGIALVDETCKAMAGYMARVVSHYTSGGFHDECGHWHPSGLHYNWTVLSVLNEDEHHTGAARYTRCFDQIKLAVRKVNPTIMFAGPEGTTYTAYEIDPANHQDKDPSLVPEILSLHQGVSGWDGNWDGFFLNLDSTLAGVHNLTLLRDRLAPKSEFVTNELITFMYTWCDRESADTLFEKHPDLKRSHAGACPDWQDPRSNSVKVNRKTLGWNAAAASFAYAYGQLALQGFKYVGQDQLIGGPWPDNEPSVSCLDWKTGEPNAKYYAISMLANALGAGPKSFFNISIQVPPPPPPPPPEDPITTLADCAAKAKGCAKANFVSFSAHNHECSWFEACIYSEPGGWPPLNVSEHTRLDPHMFGPTYGTYTSQVVKSTGSHKVGATAVGLCMESKKYASQNCSSTSPGSWDTRPGYNSQELSVSPLFALPFIVHEDAAKGILIVAKSEQGAEVVLTESPNGTTALVLEGVGSEPGFGPPIEKVVGADGRLSLGPFGVAIVSFGT